MGASVDILNPEKPKRVAIVASNPATSKQTGWPIGVWWSELTHPYWEFTERGYQVDIYSPEAANSLPTTGATPETKAITRQLI